jgi:HlyD family secretion protein
MHRSPSLNSQRGPTWARVFVACTLVLAGVVLSGCHKEKTPSISVTEAPIVRLMKPPIRKIVRNVGQPSFVEAYERTSIYPKMTGYIGKWNVDIGDKVKKDQVMATLLVPELEEEYETKKFLVMLDEKKIDLAQQVVKVAEAEIKSADAKLDETKANLDKYEADVKRWDVQVTRLTREVEKGIVDPQVLLAAQNQLRATIAGREAAKATIEKAKADVLSKNAYKL